MSIYDVAGGEKVRDLWKHYFSNEVEGIVYVIDSSDTERYDEARQALESVLMDPQIGRHVPLVLALNKNDLSDKEQGEVMTLLRARLSKVSRSVNYWEVIANTRLLRPVQSPVKVLTGCLSGWQLRFGKCGKRPRKGSFCELSSKVGGIYCRFTSKQIIYSRSTSFSSDYHRAGSRYQYPESQGQPQTHPTT